MKFERITNPESIDSASIVRSISSGNYVTVQFDDAVYSDQLLSDLDALASSLDDRLEIRFYAHEKGFDLNTLLQVPNVKNLTLDFLKKVSHLDVLSKLDCLERLSFDIEPCVNKEILNFKNLHSLKELSITTKKANLAHLECYTDLRRLAISGEVKNIQAIGGLRVLDTLYLKSINKKTTLEFLNKLSTLTSLYISFGSRATISEISNSNLEELTLSKVRDLSSLGSLSRFPKLKKLKVTDQAQIKAFEFGENSELLEFLMISNCKELHEIRGLDTLTNLKTLGLLRLPKISFDDVLAMLPDSLNHFNFYTETKRDAEIKERIRELGYTTS